MVKDEIIRPRDITAETGLSRTTIWRLEKTGDFPGRIRLSVGAVGYVASQVRAWREARQVVGGNPTEKAQQVA